MIQQTIRELLIKELIMKSAASKSGNKISELTDDRKKKTSSRSSIKNNIAPFVFMRRGKRCKAVMSYTWTAAA